MAWFADYLQTFMTVINNTDWSQLYFL